MPPKRGTPGASAHMHRSMAEEESRDKGRKRSRGSDDEGERTPKRRNPKPGDSGHSSAHPKASALPPRTPQPNLPSSKNKTPASRTPGSQRWRRSGREGDSAGRDSRQRESPGDPAMESVVQNCIELLQGELEASGVTRRERNKDHQVLFTASALGTLILDNEQLRARLNDQLKDGPGKPLTLDDEQKAHMKTNLRGLRDIYDELADKAERSGRGYVWPSLMSQANARALPEHRAVQWFEDLVSRVRNIIWENMDPKLVREGIKPKWPGEEHSLPGLEFCVYDAGPYLRSEKQPELMFVLLEAYIWYRLQRYIFNVPAEDWNSAPAEDEDSTPSTIRPGPSVPIAWCVGFGPALFTYFGEAKGIIKNEFPEMLPQLHQLRSKLATFLDRLHGDPQWKVQVAAITEVFSKNLHRFVKEEHMTRYLRSALEIIDRAMKLDIRMRRSVADWEIRPLPKTKETFRKGPWIFKRDHMKLVGSPTQGDEDPNPSPLPTPKIRTFDASPGKEVKPISLFVSPELSRAGTEDGGNYFRAETIIKSRVVIDPEEFQREYPLPEGEGGEGEGELPDYEDVEDENEA